MTCSSCINARPDASQIKRARAIMCHWCLWAEHDTGPWDGTAVSCTISGRPVDVHISSCRPSCPKNLHPDGDGLVRYLWITWYGVPAFLRWMLGKRLTGPVPGCGCMRWAKNLWLRIKGASYAAH